MIVGGEKEGTLNNIDKRPFLKSYTDTIMAWKVSQRHIK